MIPQCSSYGGELIKIDSQEKQTYIAYTMGKSLYLSYSGNRIGGVMICGRIRCSILSGDKPKTIKLEFATSPLARSFKE